MPPWLASIVLVVLGARAAPAQEVGSCKTCAGDGLVACKGCAKLECSPSTLFCKEALACKECGGARESACKRCGSDVAALLEDRRTKGRDWLTRMGEIDARLERELPHAESLHFVLTCDVGPVDAPGGKTAHGTTHLYLERLEELFARVASDLSANPIEDFLDKTHVLLWRSALDQEKAARIFTNQQSSTESKLMGAHPVVTIFYDKNHLHEEFELHQAVVHQVAHCLLSNVWDGIWPGNLKGGWLDEGFAHHYEIALFGGVRHYCYVEADTLRDFKFGRWEPSVREAVDKDQLPSFLQVASRNTENLAEEEHLFAWSYVDFLLRAHPGKLGPIARGIKAKLPLAEVLEGALDASPFAFESAWKDFVREHYSLQKKRG